MTRPTHAILTTILLVVFSLALNAGAIGPGGFVSPVIETYDGLGWPQNNPIPVTLNGNVYTTMVTYLRYYAFGGGNCVTAECLGSDYEFDFIDIVLGTPVLRAGGWVGGSPGNVQFFDEADTLLGTVPVSPVYDVSMAFAGWEADAGLIKRIRINDTTENWLIVSFDNLTVEGGGGGVVPEPSSLVLLGAGLIALAMRSWKLRRT